MFRTVSIGGGVALLAAVALPSWGAATQGSASDPAVQAAIVRAVEKERTVYGGSVPVPAVLVGVWDGRGGVYTHAFGKADLATGRALTGDDHFRIGSNTKTFLISVLLQLVDEGKLRLDDPISRFSLQVSTSRAGTTSPCANFARCGAACSKPTTPLKSFT